MITRLFIFFISIIVFAGCDHKQNNDISDLGRANVSPVIPTRTLKQTNNSTQTKKQSNPNISYKGEILELINVEHYTYIKFKTATLLEKWAAVFKGNFKKGQIITISQSIEMQKFKSPTLNKTFDTIIFGEVTSLNGKPIIPAADPHKSSQQLPQGHPAI